MWLFCGEPDERDDGERERSETGRRLYCCMDRANMIWGREAREAKELYTWSGICICDRSRSSGHGTKKGKGPDGSDGFDFDSRGEGKGKGTKKSREVIKLEAVFHSGPRVRIATCYVA